VVDGDRGREAGGEGVGRKGKKGIGLKKYTVID